eukprot:TRINITY_DN1848_c0_g1_i1.p1 TRINITY_DN1848_c0_g1~~TRINITY_DN1848_c0_g1_i1.p1  ORF type:complete len:202 (-),score=21.62 TRINITY_DN1848_c0_g1_i1:72-677(-)
MGRTVVKFFIDWKDEKLYNIAVFDEPEKDASFPEDEGSGGYRRPRKEAAIKLSNCLDAYTEEETLGEDNAWYCSECKKHQQAQKKIDLWRLPEICVIHLKRFSYTRHWRNKINSLVDFPLKSLDLAPWLSDNCSLKQGTEYDLFGCSMHSGGMGGGHYTAYAQSCKTGQWHYLNDSSVSICHDPSTVVCPSAYLLFYKRKK